MPYRVLPGGRTPGQTLVADRLGNGDYSSIQAALNAAHARGPGAGSRWLVLVAPGVYPEGLTLYDYVDLAGLAPGQACVVCPTSGPAILNAADCMVANLRLASTDAPAVAVENAGGPLELQNLRVELETAEHALHLNAAATVRIWGGTFQSAGAACFHNSARVEASDTRFVTANSGAGWAEAPVISLGSGGSLRLERCSVLNLADEGGGGIAVHATMEAYPGLALLHCLLRKSGGAADPVVKSNYEATAIIVGCLVNGTIGANIGGVIAGNTTGLALI